MTKESGSGTVTVTVHNLGGIESEQLTFDPGVSVLTGRNATNRTSMLRAIRAALGGSDAALKVDTDDGEVELVIDTEQYGRQYRRTNGSVEATGEPYTEDGILVDTFASLLKSNPVRRSVESGDGRELREAVMAPVDTASIKARIEEVQRQRRTTETRIQEIKRERTQLPELEGERADQFAELESVTEALDHTRSELETAETDIEAAEEAEAVIEALTDARATYQATRDELSMQRASVEALKSERAEVEAELDALTVPEAERSEIESELGQLQERERRTARSIDSLLSIIEFNETMIDGDPRTLRGGSEGDMLSGLVPGAESMDCWTCGSTVPRGAIVNQLDVLRELAADQRAERAAYGDRIATLRERQQEYEYIVEQQQQLQSRLEAIDRENGDRTRRINSLEEQLAEYKRRIEELEGEAADTEGLRESDLLEQYQRVSELEYERGRLERELQTTEEAIAELEALKTELEQLKSRRHQYQVELESLRTRIDDLERSVVETFNEHASTVIELLDYENIERVWLDRRGDGELTGDSESTFELHVVRLTEEGTTIEDTLDHLSESERELVGLIVALAGYLAHEVYETVPLMLLDSLEAIDAERIATLLNYFIDHVPYLVVALLPDDAAALDEDHHRIPMTTMAT